MRQFCSHASGRPGDCLKGMADIDIDHPRIAVVTGGSSGIGRHTAIRLAQRGTRVVVTYNSNPDGAAETVATIEGEGGSALALALDIGQSETFDAFADRSRRRSTSAGAARRSTSWSTTPARASCWRRSPT